MDKKPKYDKEHDELYLEDAFDIVSATECTGMIARPPMNDDEVEGYMDIFHRPQQTNMPAQKAETPEEQEKRSK